MTTLREVIEARGVGGDCIEVPFEALKDGRLVKVLAVLNRTAIYEDDRPFERHVDLQEHFEVGELRWLERRYVNSVEAASARGRKAARANRARRRANGWRNAV